MPAPPKLSVTPGGKFFLAQWQAAAGNPANWWVWQARVNGTWTTQILPGSRSDFHGVNGLPEAIALRAVDRVGNMSEPAIWAPRKYSAPATTRGMKR